MLADEAGGGAARLEQGTPDIRMVRAGRPAEGRGWIGLTRREAYQLRDVRQVSLAPAWLMLVLSAGLIFGLRGTIERVTSKVFLLSPADVNVTAEDKERIAGGFFNQS